MPSSHSTACSVLVFVSFVFVPVCMSPEGSLAEIKASTRRSKVCIWLVMLASVLVSTSANMWFLVFTFFCLWSSQYEHVCIVAMMLFFVFLWAVFRSCNWASHPVPELGQLKIYQSTCLACCPYVFIWQSCCFSCILRAVNDCGPPTRSMLLTSRFWHCRSRF